MPSLGLGLGLSHAINLAGGGEAPFALTEIDFSSVPANWTESPASMFNWSASGGYSFHDGAYAYGGNSIALFWCPSSALWTPGIDIDCRWTFKWLAAADTTTEQMYFGIGGEPVGTTNDANPALIGPGIDRNFNRYYPGRAIAASSVANPTSLTNGTSLHNLSGGELTADDATDHTVGFQVTDSGGTKTFRTFFDGTEQISSFALTAAEAAIFNVCDRPMWRGPLASVSSLLFRIKAVEFGPAGSIYA